MALNAVGQNTISKAAQAAKALENMIGLLDELNVLYDAGGGFKETIQQADLDAIASFSGITKQQLDDGMYVLTAIIRPAVHDNFTQLIHLAARA